jgi:hypothetical protein
MDLGIISFSCKILGVTTQPAGAVQNAQLVKQNTGKLQHPCDNSIQDRTAFILYITTYM